jgi:shikimate kinase
MQQEKDIVDRVRRALGQRPVVLVGLMGCGKSSIGKRLAAKLGLLFVDADEEIERVAQKSISEIFADHGEPFFRDRESKVIGRLLAAGPQVLATGGGAFINPGTRQEIRERGISIWLRAELPVLMRRVGKRDSRPLLKTADPEAVMRRLMAERYPIYAEADIMVESRDVPHDAIVTEIIEALLKHPSLAQSPPI